MQLSLQSHLVRAALLYTVTVKIGSSYGISMIFCDEEDMKMISKKMNPLVQNNSVIRVMFEEGKRLAAIYGAENVYDFSLGNPNVPAPQEVEDSILETLKEE